MENKNLNNDDILSSLDLINTNIDKETKFDNNDVLEYDSTKISNEMEDKIHEETYNNLLKEFDEFDNIKKVEKIEEKIECEEKQITQKVYSNKVKKTLVIFGMLFKYSLTSAFIFTILLLTTNYSAYLNIVKSYIYAEEIEQNEKSLLNSVKANYIKKDNKEEEEENIEEDKSFIKSNNKDYYSINRLLSKEKKDNINLNIEITPYENRIVIPKIGKNIPLIDIKNTKIAGKNELNDIFMKELENGVIRYPGSVKPGKEGNTFIFGHSSNFPWIDGEYNEVFALLDKVVFNDEIVIYYGQKKYTYKIREKKIISPGDVSLLKRNQKKSELTLMTCWPVGTTLNRLVVIGDLVEEDL